jgi:hypothetical protein
MFDPDRAHAIVEQFAFPRRSGSDGNRRALEQSVHLLSQLRSNLIATLSFLRVFLLLLS